MEKPLLLIDMDGPLNPYAAKPTRRPEGYETHRITPVGWHEPLHVWLNPDHGRMLLTLADRFELTWCTTWGEQGQANTVIGPLVGLPRLPVIDVGHRSPFDRGDGIWKRGPVERYAAGRAFAWFDDDFETSDFKWATERAFAGVPTLLVHIDPAVGIVQADIDAVAAWADEVTS